MFLKRKSESRFKFYLNQYESNEPAISYTEIIKRLMGKDYEMMIGSPEAPSRMKEFVRAVTERIPEFRGKEEWEIEETVQDAVEWAIKNICDVVKTAEKSYPPDYDAFAGVYSCVHPRTGQFYITVNEEEDASSGFGFFGFEITKDKKKALEDYRSIVSEWKGEWNRGKEKQKAGLILELE